MIKTVLFSLITFFFCSLTKAQVAQIAVEKKHYSLKSSDSMLDLTPFEMALNSSINLDEFRLIDKQRVIYFERNSVSVELFSATELLEKYGKQISQYTIKNESEMIPVVFQLKEFNGKYSIEPLYQKVKKD